MPLQGLGPHADVGKALATVRATLGDLPCSDYAESAKADLCARRSASEDLWRKQEGRS